MTNGWKWDECQTVKSGTNDTTVGGGTNDKRLEVGRMTNPLKRTGDRDAWK